jgi:hypothetical protein
LSWNELPNLAVSSLSISFSCPSLSILAPSLFCLSIFVFYNNNKEWNVCFDNWRMSNNPPYELWIWSVNSLIHTTVGRFSLILENYRYRFFKSMCEDHLDSYFFLTSGCPCPSATIGTYCCHPCFRWCRTLLLFNSL